MRNCIFGLMVAFCAITFVGCEEPDNRLVSTKASSGIGRVEDGQIKVPVGADGRSAEQRNILKRAALEGPGAMKHLYVIASTTGDVLLYSTVDGKVTSSGKRLDPTSVHAGFDRVSDMNYYKNGVPVIIGGVQYYTTEVPQADGTYGSSDPSYLYWFDAQGRYHQHYVSASTMIHISTEPLAVGDVVLDVSPVQE